MNKMLRKIFAATTKAVEDSPRTLIVTISTDSPDRSGDIVVPKGGDLDNFRKNPVVLYAHNYSGLPIATCIDLQVNEHSIVAKVQFPEKGIYELADIVYEMYTSTPALLSAWSIGFIAMDYEEIEDDDDDEYSSWYGSYEFTAWEMLEFSAVPVPANPEALTQVRTLGFNPDTVKEAWKELKNKKALKMVKTEIVKEEQVVPEKEEKEIKEEVEGKEIEPAEVFEVKRIDETHLSVTGKDLELVVDLKSGRTISAKHEQMLTQATELIKTVLATALPQEDDEKEQPLTSSTLKRLQRSFREQDKSIGLTLRTLNKALSVEGGE